MMQASNGIERILLSKFCGHSAAEGLGADTEMAALSQFSSTARTFRRGADIIAQGCAYDSLFMLVEGFAWRYRIMIDGRRQVLNVLIPGDIIGFPACLFEKSLYSIGTLSRVVVHAISFERIAAFYCEHPRLAIALLWSTAREAALCGEHLTNVGWRSASERLAHFLLEIATRLSTVGLCDGFTFDLPLTQAKLADVLALSIPHVNRTLRALREEGLIEMSGPKVRIVNRAALMAIADFDESYLTGPPPRQAVSELDACFGRMSNHFASLDAATAALPGT